MRGEIIKLKIESSVLEDQATSAPSLDATPLSERYCWQVLIVLAVNVPGDK